MSIINQNKYNIKTCKKKLERLLRGEFNNSKCRREILEHFLYYFNKAHKRLRHENNKISLHIRNVLENCRESLLYFLNKI